MDRRFHPAWLVGAAALALLAGCGERRGAPAPAPQARATLPAPVLFEQPAGAPVAEQPGPEPETHAMGAGPALQACGIKSLPEDILRQINAVRAAGARCGGRQMGPAAPLRWDTSLQGAASAHSVDMAGRNYFDHRSPDGRSVRDRTAATGYSWRTVGENIAGGDTTVDGVMNGWLGSPAHCENIMEPRFSDIAVACVQRPGSQWGTYWTMVLGRRQ